MMIDREALAWAAGFFDGEGHAGTILVGASCQPRFSLAVTQYELTTLERFQRAVGGIGRIYTGRTPAPSGRLRSSWQSPRFEVAQAVAAMLWPWLSAPKRAQIASALAKYHVHYAPRGLSGERNPAAKLTADQVVEIRRRYVRYGHGDTLHSLGVEYGVSHATIASVVTGAKWGAVA